MAHEIAKHGLSLKLQREIDASYDPECHIDTICIDQPSDAYQI
jgi:hypothetical protein